MCDILICNVSLSKWGNLGIGECHKPLRLFDCFGLVEPFEDPVATIHAGVLLDFLTDPFCLMFAREVFGGIQAAKAEGGDDTGTVSMNEL